ncbi:porin [Aquincola sp. S2]|uniref:Porin n=1 Tax=Pseudaquabacterium terrae TaxID=2732868 RepID=A0ABX2EP55_9BURK|nr:porin [Aquabacterium terrae]NRF70431.1 porin [Aquabacterium terrae]
MNPIPARRCLPWLLPLGLLAGAAQAQVTLYGRANIDFEKISLGGTPAADVFGGNQRASSNSSRFGIRYAKEHQGLTWFVQLESGVSWDAGGDTLAGRDTFAGVEGGLGKLRIGKMDTPFKDLGGLTDRFKGTGIQDDGSIAVLGGSNNGFGRRQNNSLRYDSPRFNGLRGALQYGLDNEDRRSGEQRKLLSLSAQYEAGKFKAALAHEQHRNFNVIGHDDRGWRIGLNHDFGVVNVGAGFNRLEFKLPTGRLKRHYATVTAGLPVGNGVINLRYGRAADVSGTAPASASIAGADGTTLVVGRHTGATQFTVGYEHTVFKGAQVYAYWTQVRNQANANYRFGVNPLTVAAADRGADPSGVVVGLCIDF